MELLRILSTGCHNFSPTQSLHTNQNHGQNWMSLFRMQLFKLEFLLLNCRL